MNSLDTVWLKYVLVREEGYSGDSTIGDFIESPSVL